MLSGNGSVGNISIDFEMLISCNFNSLRDSSIYYCEMKRKKKRMKIIQIAIAIHFIAHS